MPCRNFVGCSVGRNGIHSRWHFHKIWMFVGHETDLDAPVPPHTGWSGLSYPPYGVPGPLHIEYLVNE